MKKFEQKKKLTVNGPQVNGQISSLVGQIAKLKGCKVAGSAGGEELGLDAFLDHKLAGFSAANEAYDGDIDVCFENMGSLLCEFNQTNCDQLADLKRNYKREHYVNGTSFKSVSL